MKTSNRLQSNGHDTGLLPGQPVGETTFTPRVDILETDEALTLFADLPGVRAEDLDVRWNNRELVLHGRVRPRERGDNPLRQEYATGDFRRVFRINEDVDVEKITAELTNGVLTLRLPKSDRSHPRRIAVRGV